VALAVVLAAWLAAAVLVLPRGTDAGAPEVPRATLAGAKADAARLRIGTFNSLATLRPGAAASDIVGVVRKGRPHVLALQEMGSPDRRARVRRALVSCRDCAFKAFVPSGAVAASTPILWRDRRLALVGSSSRQLTQAKRVGPRGAGPSVLRPRYVNIVHLRDRITGRHLYVLNNHAVPTVQTGSGQPNPRAKGRLEIYRKHMRGLQEIVQRLRGTGAAVFVVGDLNVSYRSDRVARPRVFPYARMRDVGMRASYEATGLPRRGTHVLRNGHSLRLIDYVYYLKRRGSVPIEQRIMGGFRSDHRPLVVTVDLKRRG
jgi:endonuclease/exonuclease/phosphatase family metal-dependent hydrolase